MWIFTNKGCISVVQDWDNPAFLWVRSRTKGQIEAVAESLPNGSFKVQHTPNNDYAYRAKMTRQQVQELVLRQVVSIDYTNYKNSIKDNAYHSACSSVWTAMVNACGTGCYAAKKLLRRAAPAKRSKKNAGVRSLEADER